jgi:hypothetical protein
LIKVIATFETAIQKILGIESFGSETLPARRAKVVALEVLNLVSGLAHGDSGICRGGLRPRKTVCRTSNKINPCKGIKRVVCRSPAAR